MADVVVSDNEPGTEEIAEHNAAVAEGAATVRAEQATEAANRAEAAVQDIGAISAVTADTANVSMAAAQSSAESAAVATQGADAVLAAIQAQTATVQSLVKELREMRTASQAPAPATEKPRKTATDRAPVDRKEHPYFKRIGRRKAE